MEQRIFGRELTNLLEADITRYKRNHSFLHADRLREHSLAPKQPAVGISRGNASNNRTLPEQKKAVPKLELVDPQMVPEYFVENLQFMMEQERGTSRLTNYVPTHKTISEQSRAKLIDWLSELTYKFKMFPETIFTVVALLDQYLSGQEVPLGDLQLVGVAALFIAAKFEETYQVPQLKQLVACCANQYSSVQILQKEADILEHLNFSLIVDSAYKFLEPLCRVVSMEAKNRHLAQYLLELALLQPRFLNYPPSLMASSAIYLIKKIRKSEAPWSDAVASVAGYREAELKSCAKDLCCLLEGAGQMENCKAIKKKFSLPAYHEVTRIRLERKEK